MSPRDLIRRAVGEFVAVALCGGAACALSELKAYRWQVAVPAVFGTLLSTVVVGYGMWLALPFAGLPLPLLSCVLFGALISPTDPIAVMGIIKASGAPQTMELVIVGESLFNDGMGVVIFSLLLPWSAAPRPPHGTPPNCYYARPGGGIVFGLILGYITFRLLKSVDNYQVEVLLTLAAVTGGDRGRGAQNGHAARLK